MKIGIMLASLGIAAGLAGCGQVSGPTDKQPTVTKTSHTTPKTTAYSDEEYAMAAFFKVHADDKVNDDKLRVQARDGGLFIGDEDSDTQGYVMAVSDTAVEATDANGKASTFTKASLRKLLKEHRADYKLDLKFGKLQADQAQAKAGATADASSASTVASTTASSTTAASSASASSSTSDASGVDMKNLSTAQVQDWIVRNINKYTSQNVTDPKVYGWQYDKDDQGQLTVFLTEDHEYTNAHYGTNADPDVAPTVASFTVTSDGELTVDSVGTTGMDMYHQITGDTTGSTPAVVADNFND